MENKIAPFKLERYFAQYEFSTRYLISSSDCESLSLQDILSLADGECRTLWENLSLGYTESLGHPLLREQIASMYDDIQAEQVMLITPEEGIYITLQTLLQPGDHVIAVMPAYQSLYEIARSQKCEISPLEIHLQGNQWGIDLQKLEDSIQPNTRMIILNFPHNPTGYLPSVETFSQISALAEKNNIFLFNDEMYRWMELNPEDRLPSAVEINSKSIILSGMSKSLAMPGLRIGWLITRDPAVYKAWTIYKDYTTICSSAPSEILALIGLRAWETILHRNMDIIKQNLHHTEAFFAKFSNLFRWLPPQAGSIAFPEYLPSQPIQEFSLEVIRALNIMIAPGNLFDHSGNHFRIGLGRKNLQEALQILEEYLPKKSYDF